MVDVEGGVFPKELFNKRQEMVRFMVLSSDNLISCIR